jgi:hypothetical protein
MFRSLAPGGPLLPDEVVYAVILGLGTWVSALNPDYPYKMEVLSLEVANLLVS